MDQTIPPADTTKPPPGSPRRPAFQDPSGRARTAVGWLLAIGFILAVQLVEYLYLAGGYGVTSDLDPSAIDAGLEMVDIVLAVLLLVAFIGTVVVFLRWMSCAYANVRTLGFAPRFDNAQTIWTWFVPIFNLWRPKQLANDIWRSGDPAAALPYGDDIVRLATPGWLLVWWVLLIVPAGGAADDSIISWLVFAGTLAPSAFFAAKFVREASARQVERDAQLTRAGHPAGASPY